MVLSIYIAPIIMFSIDVLNRMIQWVEVLRTKEEIEQIKTKVLFEIIDGF